MDSLQQTKIKNGRWFVTKTFINFFKFTPKEEFFSVPQLNDFHVSCASTISPGIILDFLKDVDEHHWIMMPGYWNKDFFDYQLGVTGSCFWNENPHACVQREVGEEIGCLIKKCPKFIEHSNHKRYSLLVSTGLNNVEVKQNIREPFSGSENKLNKVQVLLHGSMKDVIDFVEKLQRIRQGNFFGDNISSLAFVSVKDIRKMLFQSFSSEGFFNDPFRISKRTLTQKGEDKLSEKLARSQMRKTPQHSRMNSVIHSRTTSPKHSRTTSPKHSRKNSPRQSPNSSVSSH